MKEYKYTVEKVVTEEFDKIIKLLAIKDQALLDQISGSQSKILREFFRYVEKTDRKQRATESLKSKTFDQFTVQTSAETLRNLVDNFKTLR